MKKGNYFKGQAPKEEITDAEIWAEANYMSKGIALIVLVIFVGLLAVVM